VRVRAALAATAVVALILAVSAAVFVLLQRQQLESTLAGFADQEAAAVAAVVAQDGEDTDLASIARGEHTLVQVVSSTGRVFAASRALAGAPPVVAAHPAPGQVVRLRTDHFPIGEEEPFAVVARGVAGPDGDAVVISAESLVSAERATAVLVRLLAIGYPILLVLVAGILYWLTGLALAPVEAMRRRVAGISATDLGARVPVPPSRDEVAQLAHTLNAMLDRLAAAAEGQRRFVADASHELRSPLTTIRAAHEVAAAHPDASDWRAVNADVLAELDRLERLVDDLLFLARSDEHGLRAGRDEVDLDDLVAAEAGRLRRTSPGLQVIVQQTPVRVIGDRHDLARALRNLADNAARHAAGRVELRVARQDGRAVVDVLDDGPGIAAEERERIFERFVRLDASRRRDAGGSGLGLPIAREILRAHGGELATVPHPRGAQLRARLPLAAGALPPDPAPRDSGPPAGLTPARGRGGGS
jgi:signal transduction histidine kinase